MAINPSIGLVGIAKQTDRDTPATAPTYVHGLTGGSPFGASRSIANTDVACGTRAPSDARVDSISITPNIQSLCYPDAFGEFTMGDVLPYFTIWSQVGVNGFARADGCKCDSLEISASGNEHLAMTASFQGLDGKVGLTDIPGDKSASCFDGKYTTTDCTFKLDAAGSTPAEALVSECSFTFGNNVSALTSLGRVTPREIAEGRLSAGISVTTIPDDLKEYQKLLTGSETSTDITGKVVLGSVYAKFFHTDNPDYTLEIKADHIPFTAEFPEVDPSGSEATIQFTTDAAIVTSASESPVKVIIRNNVASYTA